MHYGQSMSILRRAELNVFFEIIVEVYSFIKSQCTSYFGYISMALFQYNFGF